MWFYFIYLKKKKNGWETVENALTTLSYVVTNDVIPILWNQMQRTFWIVKCLLIYRAILRPPSLMVNTDIIFLMLAGRDLWNVSSKCCCSLFDFGMWCIFLILIVDPDPKQFDARIAAKESQRGLPV
jgi:hypothetical protein